MYFDKKSHEFFEIAGPNDARSQNRSQFLWGMKKKIAGLQLFCNLTMPVLCASHTVYTHGFHPYMLENLKNQ